MRDVAQLRDSYRRERRDRVLVPLLVLLLFAAAALSAQVTPERFELADAVLPRLEPERPGSTMTIVVEEITPKPPGAYAQPVPGEIYVEEEHYGATWYRFPMGGKCWVVYEGGGWQEVDVPPGGVVIDGTSIWLRHDV